MATIRLGDIRIDVIRKKIKHVRLSVSPPLGRVLISAPVHLDLEAIRIFAASKLGWIGRQREKMKSGAYEPPRVFANGAPHAYLGARYPLVLTGHRSAGGVTLRDGTIEVHMRGASSSVKAKNALTAWYRARLRDLAGKLIRKWEPVLDVKVNELGIKVMKTRWGTCNPRAGRIWINLELIKKTVECLEYVVVHEMIHLLVRNHGPDFKRLMHAHVPEWKRCRHELNRTSLRNID
jgi:predicted metal-dependent hydrolase